MKRTKVMAITIEGRAIEQLRIYILWTFNKTMTNVMVNSNQKVEVLSAPMAHRAAPISVSVALVTIITLIKKKE